MATAVGGMGLAPAACSGSSDVTNQDGGAVTVTATVTATNGSGASGSSGGSSSGSSSSSSSNDTTWLFAFNDPDAGLAGWAFNPYQTPADTNDADGIDLLNLSQQATIAWDNSGGTAPLAPDQGPVNGMMTVTIPFSAYNQKADFHIVPVPAAAMDLSHSVLTMWVKLDPLPDGAVPFSPSNSAPGGIVIYIKTGGKYVYGSVGYQNIDSTKHGWIPYSFDVQNMVNTQQSASNWAEAGDPTNVVEIGFFFHTGGGAIPTDGGPDTQSPYGNPSPATFHIDSIGISPAQQ